MGTNYYATVPKFKIAFYIGRNNMDIEFVEEMYDKLQKFSDTSIPEIMYKDLNDFTLADIKWLLMLADIGEDITSINEVNFIIFYLKSLNIKYEIVPDYEVPDDYVIFDNI